MIDVYRWFSHSNAIYRRFVFPGCYVWLPEKRLAFSCSVVFAFYGEKMGKMAPLNQEWPILRHNSVTIPNWAHAKNPLQLGFTVNITLWLWHSQFAMENSHGPNRNRWFSQRTKAPFIFGDFPWRTVSHNQFCQKNDEETHGLPEKTIYHLIMTNSSPWKDPPIFKNGQPSISIRAMAIFHGELLVITRG